MKIVNFNIQAIAVTNKYGNVIALISDDDIIEHDDCKVTLIADDSDYKFKVFKDGSRVELIPKDDSVS